MIKSDRLVILDTNVLVFLIRNNEVGQRIEGLLELSARPERPCISVVTVGEALALAKKFGWGSRKCKILEDLMRELVIVDISSDSVLRAYAELDHLTRTKGRPIGKNDLWIAATTMAIGAHLITTDTDFDILHPNQIERTWVDPNPKNQHPAA